jgi:hypothetical protein
MAINLIDTGVVANDGTGDPIRNAFQTVNSNFDYINGGLFAGTQSSIISAVSVTAGYIVANTYVNANAIVGDTVTSHGNLYVSQNGAYIIGNVKIIGNLSVSGSQAASQSQQSSSPILALHYSATPLVVNDGKDIGLEWQYYSGAERKAFFGRQNSTGTLIYQDNITDTANVITAGTFGNVQFGSLVLSNTTASTSNVTGALQVAGGVGVQGNLYVQNNVFVGSSANVANLTVRGYHLGSLNFIGSDTVYINGSPVQTAAQAFNGGTVALATYFADATQSTSTTTGAVKVAGGLGIVGNIWASNIQINSDGALRANVLGNIIASSQPYVTSLGTLTGLNLSGQLNTNDISPNDNQVWSLGTATNDRWLKIWAYDMDLSGTLTGATINAQSGKYSASTIATSTTTGALVVTGGVGVGGNLYVAGSNGTAITATGNIALTGNILPGANVTYNLGSTTQWFNVLYGRSTQAQYADLAENYIADQHYDYGTVVVFGGDKEITVTNEFADHRVAGVISQNPAYLMNAAVTGLPVALRGRVPVRVTGPVAKGDLLVTSTTPGFAQSVGSDTGFGVRIFAKALEDNTSTRTKIIEAVII